MMQLWVVVGVLAVANYAIFNGGVEFYEKNFGDENKGVVEVYEVDEEAQQAESTPESTADKASETTEQ